MLTETTATLPTEEIARRATAKAAFIEKFKAGYSDAEIPFREKDLTFAMERREEAGWPIPMTEYEIAIGTAWEELLFAAFLAEGEPRARALQALKVLRPEADVEGELEACTATWTPEAGTTEAA